MRRRLTANRWADRQRKPEARIYREDDQGRRGTKRSRMLFRHRQENISDQQHQGQASRNSRMLDWNVLLCQEHDESP